MLKAWEGGDSNGLCLRHLPILFGIIKTALDEEENFFTWVRDNHFFLWLQFFVDR